MEENGGKSKRPAEDAPDAGPAKRSAPELDVSILV